MAYPGGSDPNDPYSQSPFGDKYPQQPYQQQPYQQPYAQQPFPQQQPYGQPYPQQYGGFGVPEHPQSTMIMVLGIVSLAGGAICWLPALAGPFAVVMGRKALQEIDASGGAIGGRGQVMAGFICGLITTALLVLVLLIVIFAIAVAVSSG